jgi:hypothetical protein
LEGVEPFAAKIARHLGRIGVVDRPEETLKVHCGETSLLMGTYECRKWVRPLGRRLLKVNAKSRHQYGYQVLSNGQTRWH